jgi:cytochrome c oxidase subunit 3
VVWEAWRGTIPPENYSTVEVVSLYWHLVDAIWLFLMPLLYLAGIGMFSALGGH